VHVSIDIVAYEQLRNVTEVLTAACHTLAGLTTVYHTILLSSALSQPLQPTPEVLPWSAKAVALLAGYLACTQLRTVHDPVQHQQQLQQQQQQQHLQLPLVWSYQYRWRLLFPSALTLLASGALPQGNDSFWTIITMIVHHSMW
jgi:hypothetical protein